MLLLSFLGFIIKTFVPSGTSSTNASLMLIVIHIQAERASNESRLLELSIE